MKKILEDPATAVTSKSSKFWFLVAALRHFVDHEGDGKLPLPGSIPDMHSSTAHFIALQRVYQEKAESEIRHRTESHCHALGSRSGLIY